MGPTLGGRAATGASTTCQPVNEWNRSQERDTARQQERRWARTGMSRRRHARGKTAKTENKSLDLFAPLRPPDLCAPVPSTSLECLQVHALIKLLSVRRKHLCGGPCPESGNSCVRPLILCPSGLVGEPRCKIFSVRAHAHARTYTYTYNIYVYVCTAPSFFKSSHTSAVQRDDATGPPQYAGTLRGLESQPVQSCENHRKIGCPDMSVRAGETRVSGHVRGSETGVSRVKNVSAKIYYKSAD